jgi:hypothetical protein
MFADCLFLSLVPFISSLNLGLCHGCCMKKMHFASSESFLSLLIYDRQGFILLKKNIFLLIN